VIQRRRRKSAGYSGSSDRELTFAAVDADAAVESLSPSLDSALALQRSALRERMVVVMRQVLRGEEAAHVLGRRGALRIGDRLMGRSGVATGAGNTRCIGN
jgi:hypothetical protein